MATSELDQSEVSSDAVPPSKKDLSHKIQEENGNELKDIFERFQNETISLHQKKIEGIKAEMNTTQNAKILALSDSIKNLRIDLEKSEVERLKSKQENSKLVEKVEKLEISVSEIERKNQQLQEENRLLQNERQQLESKCTLLEEALKSQNAYQLGSHHNSFPSGADQPDSHAIQTTESDVDPTIISTSPEINLTSRIMEEAVVKMETAEYQCSSHGGKSKESPEDQIKSESSRFPSENQYDHRVIHDHTVNIEKRKSELQARLKQQEDYREYLSGALSVNNWQRVLRSLGVNDNKLSDIPYNYPNNAYTQRYEAVKLWFTQEGLKATPNRIVDALMSNNLRAVAEEFCLKFNLPDLLPKNNQEAIHVMPSSLPKSNQEAAKGSGGNLQASPKAHSSQASIGSHSGTAFSSSVSSDNHNIHHPSSYVPPQGGSGLTAGSRSPKEGGYVPDHQVQNCQDFSSPLTNVFSAHLVPCQLHYFKRGLQMIPVDPISKATFFHTLLEKDQDINFKRKLSAVSRNEFPNWLDLLDGWAAAVESCGITTTGKFSLFWNLRQGLLSLRNLSSGVQVEKVLAKYVGYGVLGPIRDPSEKVGEKYFLRRDILKMLSISTPGVSGWKELAASVGCESTDIILWEQDRKGPESTFHLIGTQNWRLGNLYMWMLNNGRMDIVTMMEDEKYLKS